MQQSNTYIILFSAVLTIVLGGLLSLASEGLKPRQREQVELDTKLQILSAVMEITKKDDVLSVYDKRISSLVVNIDGEVIEKDEDGSEIDPEQVDVEKNYRLDPKDRKYPVFRFMNEDDPEKVEAYILPVFGNGLWDRIWGFVALDSNFEEIKGVAFGHRAETPGLGARISSDNIQDRYIGKKIYDDDGKLVSVTMRKGEKGDPDAFDEHEVDGLSGATITANGVNSMLENYFSYYKSYMEKVKSSDKEKVALLEN